MNLKKILIIYDWDDTLFPTYWFTINNIDINNYNNIYQYKLYFQEIDNILYKLLSLSLKYGYVAIITNAQKSWVDFSAKTCLPQTYTLLNNKIEIISANDQYSETEINVNNWKINAFKNLNYNDITDIISIGDSLYEYNALTKLQYNNDCKGKYLKVIKLISIPQYNEYIDQLNLLKINLHVICKINTHLDLNFKIN
jgi:hypothetical protein